MQDALSPQRRKKSTQIESLISNGISPPKTKLDKKNLYSPYPNNRTGLKKTKKTNPPKHYNRLKQQHKLQQPKAYSCSSETATRTCFQKARTAPASLNNISSRNPAKAITVTNTSAQM